MKKFSVLFLAILPLFMQAGVTAIYKPDNNQAKDIAILENKFIRAEFSSVGGRLISFKDKRNNIDLTYKEGALRDQLLPNGTQPFMEGIYKISVKENTPQRATLVFNAPADNSREFILLSRTVTLEANSTALKVAVTITNQQESMADMALGYWQHNFFGGVNMPTEYIVPMRSGIKKMIPSKEKNTHNYEYDTDLSRNWCAMNIKGKRAGAVVIGEFPRMDMTYSWYCKGTMPMDTLEMRTYTEIIPQGQSSTWNFTVGIMSLLDTIDGAGEHGCGEIRNENGKTAVNLYAFKNIKGTAEAVVNGKVVEKYPVAVNAGKSQKIVFKSVASAIPVQFVVRGADGKVLYDLLRGSADGKYRFAAMDKRNGNQELAKEEWDLKVSESFVTPHWKWSSKKLEGKGLFLVPVDGVRDVIEISQRMPVEYDVPTVFPSSYNVSWKTVTHFDPGAEPSGTDRLMPLFKKNKYSFIVVGNEMVKARKWTDYPADVRKEIFEQVKNGAGLVCFNQIGFTAPVKLVPFKLSAAVDANAAPWFPQAKFASAAYGKGKIITVDYTSKAFLAPLPKWRSSHLAQFYCEHRFQEYQFAIIAHLIRQAMGMDETVKAVKLTDKEGIITSAIAQNAEIELFDRYSKSIVKRSIKLNAGENRIPIDLQSGKNYLHVRTESGSFGFASFNHKVQGISAIEMAKNSFRKNETVSGTVKCNIPGAEIKVDIVDNEGRLIYSAKGNNFSWNQSLAQGNRHEVIASAIVNGKTVATLKKEFYLPEQFNTFRNFPVMVWTGDDRFPEYSYLFRDEISRQFGFNFIYGGSYSCATPLLHRFANLESGTNRHENGDFRLQLANLYDPRYHKTKDKKYLTRKYCPSDPKIKNRPMYSAFYTVTPYTTRTLFQLGDEMSYTAFGHAADFCFCQYCMAEFRKVMQKKYGTMEKLNAEWKSAFTKWEDVLPQTYTEAMTQASPAAFYDFRAFMDQVFIGKLEATRQTVRKVHPKALCGPTGVSAVPGIYGGNLNFWAMSIFDCGSYYKTPRIPASFRRDERLIMQYFGYSSPAGDIRFGIWESLLAGCRGINNWYDPTFILPDLRISYIRKYYSDFMWELRNTAGEIFYHTPKFVGQAAILHSQHALIANYLKTDKVDYYSKELSFAHALEDCGIAYRFISPHELENGALNGLQLLILPETSAMSDKEIELVREFCRKGGTVIADYECGLYNENGNARMKSAFNDMFGIRQGIVRLRRVESHNINSVNITNVMSGIRPTTGKAKYSAVAGKRKVDLVIENKFGKGRAIMLNFAPQYEGNRLKGDGFANLIRNLAQIKPVAKAETSIPVMHSFFRDKDMLTVAMLPAPVVPNWRKLSNQEAEKNQFTATVKLAEKGHVYDVRRKKYLGYGDKVNASFIPGEATVLAVTKVKPQFTVDASESTVKRGSEVKFPVTVSKGNKRFILMRVYRPDGTEELGARQMRTANPEWTFTLPIAFNAPAGDWKITFDDAASNIHFEKKITVK